MTPYDTALRIKRRMLDDVRLSISVELEHSSRLEAESHALESQVAAERGVTIVYPADAWHARVRNERAQLAEKIQSASARLAQLRARAAEAYGNVRAIESAADQYRAEAEQTAAKQEQGTIDDLSGARIVRSRDSGMRRTS